ncbi:alkylated DNA repair protein (DNA oxidative demethylase) [Rhodoblastus acidophilus]|uniref:alpha-ketoglutarate-dependent dioxygenase AlkB family protein n=1 Tax=Rhodoblastus acidophilus TaxID=1074 RepID=UPI002225A183|nr:alpha-ketoglutarate-dependent dioxygenase AlkB [Rhodoblastus acidophilus]MCW2284466.1 alkylated DNA repair protein (DNA oxidative demethylase) [Rhodoblastus acidophilus]MCW2333313.1 alkylated DNA repair protein (DNA oxidative demethylase) [Rhodoblastus acidophilus]
MTAVEIRPGLHLYKTALDRAAQETLRENIREILREAPLFQPVMPRTGKAFSVRMSNCGPLGWVSDRAGYRYQPEHPVTAKPWPPIPETLLRLWRDLAGYPHDPDACLINYYDPAAKMGAHQDVDEQDFDAPILSVSLGCACRFRFGGETRGGSTQSLVLESGDVLIFGGPARKMFHGVDRILAKTSTLLDPPGRINLTLRRAR